MKNVQVTEIHKKFTCAFIKSKHYVGVLTKNFMENTRETASVCEQDKLAEQIAYGHGFNLYQQYDEKQAARFISVHPNTLKKARKSGKIAFLQKGDRAVAYFGFQLADYLITNIQTCPKQSRRNDIKSETTGSHGKSAHRLGAAHGTIAKLDRQNAVASAHRILKKQKKS